MPSKKPLRLSIAIVLFSRCLISNAEGDVKNQIVEGGRQYAGLERHSTANKLEDKEDLLARPSRYIEENTPRSGRRLNSQYNIFHINYDEPQNRYPYNPQPNYQAYVNPYPAPYPAPYPYFQLPPSSTTTTTTTTPAPGPPRPIGYMLIDTYHNRGYSHSRPLAFFTTR